MLMRAYCMPPGQIVQLPGGTHFRKGHCMIRGVIFDFGGVLVRTADPAGRRKWESRLGLRAGDLERAVHGSDLWILAQRGEMTPDAFWAAVAERLGVAEPDIPALRADYFADDHLDPALMALIADLRARGWPVALLSNDSAALEAKLRDELGIYDAFDQVIISAHIGHMKPEAATYRTAAAAIGLSTPECVFIDDNPANVDGARAVGMAAIHYRAGMDLAAALQPILYDQNPPTKAVIFDFGNVLDVAANRPAWEANREALAARYGISGEALTGFIYHSEAWQAVKVGQIDHREYCRRIWEPLGVADYDTQRALMAEYFKGRDQVHPVMMQIIQQLRGRVRLALLSNAWQTDVPAWMDEVQLAGVFEVAMSSAVVGIAKPDQAIYRLILNQLGLTPGEAIFVDDLTRNTDTAEAIGLPCIVFESPEQTHQALQRRGLL